MRGCACRGTAGFAHVSCLAEQAKILVAEAEENNLGRQIFERWARWHKCRLCEQDHHGLVCCALGWACWKTYLGRPETDWTRVFAIQQLGNGLLDGGHYEDALSVREAELAMLRRLGAPEEGILATQSNLAMTYRALGRLEEALRLRQEVYSRRLELNGEEHYDTLREANNYASLLNVLTRFEGAKSLMRKTMPVARRVLRDEHVFTLQMRANYAMALYKADSATLDDLRESVSTLEEAEQTARRVLGGAHPVTAGTEGELRDARAALRAREEALARVGGVAIFAAVALAAAAAVLVLRKKLT